MIKRSSSSYSPARRDTTKQRNIRSALRRKFPNLPLIQASSLHISDAVLQIRPDGLRDMWDRPDCAQAAKLLSEVAQYASLDCVYATAVELLDQFPNKGQRAGALRAMLPVLEAIESLEARYSFFT